MTGSELNHHHRRTRTPWFAGSFLACSLSIATSAFAAADVEPITETPVPLVAVGVEEAERFAPLTDDASAMGTLPPQPASGIIDRLDLLSIEERTRLAGKLVIAAEKDNTRVYLVTLTPADDAEAATLARGLFERWQTGGASAIVLCLSDREENWRHRFHIVPFEEGVPAELKAALWQAAAQSRSLALSKNSPSEAMETAALEIISRLRPLAEGRVADFTAPPKPGTVAEADEIDRKAASLLTESTAAWPRSGRPAFNLALVAVILGSAAVGLMIRMRRRVVVLPRAASLQYRLSAPLAGGNGASIHFRERRKRAEPVFF